MDKQSVLSLVFLSIAVQTRLGFEEQPRNAVFSLCESCCRKKQKLYLVLGKYDGAWRKEKVANTDTSVCVLVLCLVYALVPALFPTTMGLIISCQNKTVT